MIEQHHSRPAGPSFVVEASHDLPMEAPAVVIRMANRTLIIVRWGMSWAAALVALAMILTGPEQSMMTHLRVAVAEKSTVSDSSIPAYYRPGADPQSGARAPLPRAVSRA